jgi:hypothetical protein
MSYWGGIHRALRLVVLNGAVTTVLIVWQIGFDALDLLPSMILVIALMALPAVGLGVAAATFQGSLVSRLVRLEALAVGVSMLCVMIASALLPEVKFDIEGHPVPAVFLFLRYAHIFLLPTLIAVALLARWTQSRATNAAA